MRRPFRVAIALACAVAPSLGCAAVRELFRKPEDTVLVTMETDFAYEDLVPYYVELCAVSQYRPLFKERRGASPGHAVMYLKGACRDETADYPRLRPCAEGVTDVGSPEHGAGVSVNKWLRNVNWIATPGKRLFFDGNLGRYETLDRERFAATADHVMELGLLKGVEIHDPGSGYGPRSLEEFVFYEALSTDLALRFGRSVFCSRVPMNRQMLTRAMDYLNGLNDQYRDGDPYEWSGYSDNCVHALHNALAAAGVWKPKSVRAVKLRQLFNLALPSNTFVELAMLTNTYPIDDFGAIYGDSLRRRMLLEERWLPASPGALVQTFSVHQDNHMFDTKFRLFVLEGLFTAGTTKRAQRILNDGRFAEIDANARYFRDRYDRILEGWDEDAGAWRGEEYREARRSYHEYIQMRRAKLDRTLARLAEFDRIRHQVQAETWETWRQRLQ